MISEPVKAKFLILIITLFAFIAGMGLTAIWVSKASTRSGSANVTGPLAVTAFDASFFMHKYDISDFDVVYPDAPIHSNNKNPGHTGLTEDMALNVNDDVVTFDYDNRPSIKIDWLTALEKYEKEQPNPEPLIVDAQGEGFKVRYIIKMITLRADSPEVKRLADIKGMLLIDFDSPPDSQSDSVN